MYKNNIGDDILSELNKGILEDKIQKIVAGAVIRRKDGSILLLERNLLEFKGGLIELPSGGVKIGETIIDCLIREVKEETSLDVSEIKKYLGSFDYQSSSGRATRQFNFAVSVNPGDVKINPSEHSKFYTVNPTDEDWKKLNISPNTREIIEKLFK